jgi:hypothetical protein
MPDSKDKEERDDVSDVLREANKGPGSSMTEELLAMAIVELRKGNRLLEEIKTDSKLTAVAAGIWKYGV